MEQAEIQETMEKFRGRNRRDYESVEDIEILSGPLRHREFTNLDFLLVLPGLVSMVRKDDWKLYLPNEEDKSNNDGVPIYEWIYKYAGGDPRTLYQTKLNLL
ncbi:hypothetical protein MMC25_002216 [Agyrium rufum]|nr:hypothetical protein [Agyrium rufum]